LKKTKHCAKAGFIPAVTQLANTIPLQARRATGGGSAGEDLRPHLRSRGQKSQALIEFALISPLLLLLVFGIIDIGRGVFYYDTLNHAAREGARTAVRASSSLPTNANVLATVTQQLIGAPVSEPCPQGPITAAVPPGNTAWLYVTEPSPPGSQESLPPMNAPGGEYPSGTSGSCSAVNPASNNAALQVTLRFNLILITPIISQVTADRILLTAVAVYRVEY
jgi:hypothetical protein